ncbi:MAG TPA: protease pro-enzyme activation domain-containing protein [Bryobacteraceae bacterium]|nr:protease pro-enzyme activation domain-containing protein [Bryobacteraceae bacterium]
MRVLLLAFLSLATLWAQDRLRGPLELNRIVPLSNSQPRDIAPYDQGPVDRQFQIPYVTMLLKPSAAQQTDLDQLLMDQQDALSSVYHQWLKPEEFADRFGVSGADAGVLVEWLKSQGMTVHDVGRARTWITFSGAAGDIGRALHTEIHRYRIKGQDRFSNSTTLSIPAGFRDVVAGFEGLDDLYKTTPALSPKLIKPLPSLTDNKGNHVLAPADLATIYDVNPLYSNQIDGTGISIAVVGTSDILLSDIESFRRLFSLPASDPTVITYGPDPGFDVGALFEADLDLEWSGAIAPKAKIYYINAIGPFLSVLYAVDTNVAPIITMSYGYCEAGNAPVLQFLGQQANAQGITWMASSGDSGAAQCDAQGDYPQATRGETVNFPASLPEVTGVGGTTFNEGSGNYWSPTNSKGLESAISYIPETAWNETTGGTSLGATGGGASILFEKPLWQTGPGVPNDHARDVPDISLASAGGHDPYVIASLGADYLIGGTSAATPTFAAMIALLEQYLTSKGIEKTVGLGNINPNLYRLAQTTPSAFHDITSGNNIVPCVQATPNCFTGSFGFSAGKGYDQVTGLGSVDLNNLVNHWKSGSPTKTAVGASPKSIGINGGPIRLTVFVTASSGSPSGTVSFFASEIPLGTATLTTSGSKGVATLTISSNELLLGTHPLTAVYSGDKTFDGSAGSTNITITAPATGAAVVPVIANAPVMQTPADAHGNTWQAEIVLSEEVGVGATVAGLSVDGVSYDAQLSSIFKSTKLPAHGTLSGTLGFAGLAAPVTKTFVFTGTDATGASWTAQTSARFVGIMEVTPGIAVTVTPSAIPQNPSIAACEWLHQITIQEQGGNYVDLTKFAVGTHDLSANIPNIFGTAELAPFHSVHGTYCRSDAQPGQTQTLTVSGSTERGQPVQASATVHYQGPLTNAPSMSVSTTSVSIPVTGKPATGSATVSLNFGSATPAWTVSIVPAGAISSWLTVTPQSGSGTTDLTISAAAGSLGPGVYTATLAIESDTAKPQYLSVLVTMLVGDSSKIAIGGVANAASNLQAFSPGMLLSVYGSGLAPAGVAQPTGTIPLPLNSHGITATVNGLTAPLYYISPGQLNIQVPYEVASGTAVLGVNNNGQVASFPFKMTAAGPGVFTDAKGALVPNASGAAGATLVAFITGAGNLNQMIPTGFTPFADTPIADLPKTLLPVKVTVGGKPAAVQFAGMSSGLVGVVQINFVLPSGLAAGSQNVVISVGGVAAQPASVTITQ